MMFDNELLFTAITGQAVTTDAASESIDFEVASPKSDIGPGTPVFVEAHLKTAFGATTATLEIQLEHSTNDASFSDVAVLLPAKEADTIAKGRIFRFALPDGLERYIRLYFNVSTTLSDGVVVAGLTID